MSAIGVRTEKIGNIESRYCWKIAFFAMSLPIPVHQQLLPEWTFEYCITKNYNMKVYRSLVKGESALSRLAWLVYQWVIIASFATVLPVLKHGAGGRKCCREPVLEVGGRDGGNLLATGWGWYRFGPCLCQPACKDHSPNSVIPVDGSEL